MNKPKSINTHLKDVLHERSYCSDHEKFTRLEFAKNLFIESVLMERGCSWNVAKLHAESMLRKENNPNKI